VSDHAGNIAVSSPTKIPEQEIEPEPDRSTFFTEFWNILLIIFILILIVIIAVIVNKKRKKTEKPEPQPEASETVKPGTIPEAVITVGETPALPTPEQTSPQIPEPTVVTESPQIAPAVPEVPTLASSTTTAPGQVPETQQISPSTVEVPLLPAVQPETSETKDESEKEPTPELDKPIDTQMTKQVDQEK
jgi:heme/copper-type cytochrome/quinol oxidase subunit 2